MASIESDSEIDEFAEGIAQWEPDEWDAERGSDASASGSGSGSGSDSGSDVGGLGGSGDEDEDSDDGPEMVSRAGPSKSSSGSGSNADKVARARAALAALKKRRRSPRSDSDGGSGDSDGSDSDGGRGGKHAPVIMSTKRQVTRSRPAIALPSRKTGLDPRFTSASGTLNVHLHGQSYAFLPDVLARELESKRGALVLATKAERSCPLRDKAARGAERAALEREVGQLRTRLERGKREMREREVLARAKKEEREKRDKGKGEWYMKKGEKRDLLLKSRFDALEETGGKKAVKKALDKKRKKVAGKEKRSRPNVQRRTA